MDKRTISMLELIEQFNNDKIKYHNSKKFKIVRFLKMIKKLFIERNFSSLKNYIKGIKLKKYEEKYEIINVTFEPVLDKKIVVYSCIVGNYDSINEPIYFNDNVEYILFSDKDIKSNFWKVRKIPSKILKLKNKTLINRYIKLHPFELFKDYDYSIYIDGNVKTLSDISGFVNCINKKTGIAMFKHHSRKCIYIEEKACILQNKGNKNKIIKQIEKYKSENFPTNFGLLEGTIIVSDLKNENAKNLLIDWWNEFYESESLRDQLSLPYVLWKNNYKIDDIGFLGNNIRACPKLLFFSHEDKN
ncbi:MAG: DUF616 domain-containing protein [Bacilli bacterium]|nr:DUF616 domain-containing protein [Bacilli bacterium]